MLYLYASAPCVLSKHPECLLHVYAFSLSVFYMFMRSHWVSSTYLCVLTGCLLHVYAFSLSVLCIYMCSHCAISVCICVLTVRSLYVYAILPCVLKRFSNTYLYLLLMLDDYTRNFKLPSMQRLTKRQYLPHYWSNNGFKRTVVNLALPFYQEGSIKITLTIPLTFKIKINYIDIFVF